jgi:aminoglycoside phosphotransferase family enzyme
MKLNKDDRRIMTASELSESKIRALAKKVCNGHQHTFRYSNMLNACYQMGKMVLEQNKIIEKEIIKYIWDEAVISATYGKAISFEDFYNETFKQQEQ